MNVNDDIEVFRLRMFHVKHRQETSPPRFDGQPGVGYKANILENF
jgi:hypothetical protein